MNDFVLDLKNFVARGSIQALDAAQNAQLNLANVLADDKINRETNVHMDAFPTILCGVNSASGVNLLTAASIKTDSSNINRLQVDVNGSTVVTSSIPTPSSAQTPFAYVSGSIGDTNTHNLHTVTAGKKAYVTSILLTTAAQEEFHLKDNATDLMDMQMGAGIQSIAIPFGTPLQFSTNITIKFDNAAGGFVNVYGFEQ